MDDAGKADENGSCRILVADEDETVRRSLCQALSDAGHLTVSASNRSELMDLIDRQAFDLVTLDIPFGEEDGLALAHSLRMHHNIPVIIITAQADPMDRVAGLEAGADDYIAKPFHAREVEIRVRSVLERYGRLPHPHELAGELSFDHTVFNLMRRILRKSDNQEIHLTETEFKLLALFLDNPGRILSRDEIWQKLRGRNRNPLDRTLDGHIAHLREKMEADQSNEGLIRSVRGVGYVFVGDVRPAVRVPPDPDEKS